MGKKQKKKKVTNVHNISLPMAVWLLTDEYDYVLNPKAVSATFLLKPLKEQILSLQNVDAQKEIDISSLIPSKLGTAVHDSLEKTWGNLATVKQAFNALDMGSISHRLVVNPERDDDNKPIMENDALPIYMEQRVKKDIDTWTITGKYDLILNGTLIDYKTASIWSYIFGSNEDNYIKQGSIYRWLNQDIITEDIIKIETLFTDWSATDAKNKKDYPPLRVMSKDYPLMSVEDTEQFLVEKTDNLSHFIDKEQALLPLCTKEELWQKPTVYKYYKNPAATKRATANFSEDKYPNAKQEAELRKSNDGNVGLIKKFPGEVKKCIYCSVSHICMQAEELRGLGLLK